MIQRTMMMMTMSRRRRSLLVLFVPLILLHEESSFFVNSFVFVSTNHPRRCFGRDDQQQMQQRGNVMSALSKSITATASKEARISSTSLGSSSSSSTLVDTQGNSSNLINSTDTSNSTNAVFSNNNNTTATSTNTNTTTATDTSTSTTTSTVSGGLFQKPSTAFTNKMRSSLIENLLLINTTRPIHYKDATLGLVSTNNNKNDKKNNDNSESTTILVVRPPTLNDVFPNLIGSTQDTDEFDLYEYLNEGSNSSGDGENDTNNNTTTIGNSWGVIFMHPGDFTPVCTTELGAAALLQSEFNKRNIKLVGFSCNDANSHRKWIEDIQIVTSGIVKFPLFCDDNRQIATRLGILDSTNTDSNTGLPLTVRSVYILKPDKTIALMMTYPASTGRNMKELLRCIDAVQLTYVSQVATPVNWKRGDECLVDYALNDEQANQVFGIDGYRIINVPSEADTSRLPKHYMRYTKDPSAGFVRRMIQKLLQQPKPPKQ